MQKAKKQASAIGEVFKVVGGFMETEELIVKRGRGRPKQSETDPTKVDVSGVDSADAETIARKVEEAQTDERAESREEKRIIDKLGKRKMYTIVISKQSNSDNNKPIYVPNQEGGRDWWLIRGKEYVVPEYVVNIIRESILTETEITFESGSQGIKTIPNVERIPRISLEIKNEITV